MAIFEALAIGANLIESGFQIGAERERKRKRQEAYMAAADRLSTRRQQAEFGLGSLSQLQTSAVRGRLADLAQRNVLQSDIAAPAIAEATAPFDLMRQQSLDDLTQQESQLRLAADIEAADTPGFNDFMAGLAGDASTYLAMYGGRQYSRKRRRQNLADFREFFGTTEEMGQLTPEQEALLTAPIF